MTLGPLGLIDLDDPPLTLADSQIELAEAFLTVPSGLMAGEKLTLTREQIEFLIAWYAVDPTGRQFLYSRAHLEGPKGWSKSPVGMIIAFAALVGEVVPDGIDAYGIAVGRPHPRPKVQIAGVSIDGTDNLYGQLYDSLRDSPAGDAFGLDIGLTKITRAGGGEIEPVTAASLSRTGNPVTDILREETWLWLLANGGVALAATLNQNARKFGARIVDLTNCPIPGNGSVAGKTIAAVKSGRAARTLCVRIRRETRLEDINDDEAARAALVEVYGSHCTDNGGWINVDEYMEDRPPGDTTESQWRRLYLNEDTADDEAVLDPISWALLASANARLTMGETIALGFDGSDTTDATALYAVRWPDWCVFKLGVWERPRDTVTGKPDGSWKVPRLQVLAKIQWALDNFNVVRGYADPAYWQTDIDTFSADHGVAFMRFPHHSAGKIGPACERWTTMAEVEKTLTHDGDRTLIEHAANARKEPIGAVGSGWWRPARRTEGHPTDAFSAAVSAVHALGDAVAAGDVVESEVFEDFVEVI